MDSMQLIEAMAGFITILILDFKGDFVDVPQRLGRDVWDHYSATDGFYFGLDMPGGCTYNVNWINQLIRLFGPHLGLKFSKGTLDVVLKIAVNLINSNLISPLVIPSLPLVYELLNTLPSKLITSKDEYLRTLQQKIGYLLRISGQLFDAERGFDIFEHLVNRRRCAVIDCTGLDPLLASIFANYIALRLFFPLLTKRQTSKQTKYVLIIDEADILCSEDVSRIYDDGYSNLEQLVKQGREFGVAVCLGMAFLGKCSQFISSNSTYSMILNQKEPDSIDVAARTVLEPASRQLVALQQTGACVYREAMGPVKYGMTVKIDRVEPATMTRPEKFDTHPYVKARGIKDIPGLQERVDAIRNQYELAKMRIAKQHKITNEHFKLSKIGGNVLSLASVYEFDPAKALFDRMDKVSPQTQINAIKELEKNILIESNTCRTSHSPIRLIQITQKGWEFLKGKSKFKPLRGGIIHTHICRWIQRVGLKRGYEESLCEWQNPENEGFTDVAFKINGEWHCVEVVVECENNIGKHVRSCFLESKVVKTLTIVTLQKQRWMRIRKLIMADPVLVPFMDQIKFEVVSTYYNELWPSK